MKLATIDLAGEVSNGNCHRIEETVAQSQHYSEKVFCWGSEDRRWVGRNAPMSCLRNVLHAAFEAACLCAAHTTETNPVAEQSG